MERVVVREVGEVGGCNAAREVVMVEVVREVVVRRWRGWRWRVRWKGGGEGGEGTPVDGGVLVEVDLEAADLVVEVMKSGGDGGERGLGGGGDGGG
ncbi:hypothetical protein CYMTET_52859 [Cymbomonas tetramitiformis]|uniref:Uncharacterized protein n=1 Tax=Cymbomonas tetramitiformis TaxID=36881 RepID=A0AAE0BJ96_9CHLO|nr:hypothetical protein CYMTET_52859 [Cymbomonas tetramitiformis]